MKQQVKISKIKGNPKNPRIIKNDNFARLLKSIIEFPEMLKLRPIIVDQDFMVLGGNMRLKASKAAGFKEIWIDVFSEEMVDKMNLVAEAEGRETKTYLEYCDDFILKDNASFGTWDMDILANEWEPTLIEDSGIELAFMDEKELEFEGEVIFSEHLNEANNYVVLFFDNNIDWLQAQTHFDLQTVTSKRQNGKTWSSGVGRVLNGSKYLDGIKAIK